MSESRLTNITVVRSWDSLPPVVSAFGEFFSTRVLEKNHRECEEKLKSVRQALVRCHDRYRDHEHGGIADRILRNDLEEIFGFTFETYKSKARIG